MKIRKNARTGTRIIEIILIITTILLWIIKITPNVDYNTLNHTDKMMYDMGVYEGEFPIWKNICFGIACFLMVLEIIVYFLLCRCNYCRKYVGPINSREKYCPYCSKDLDKTEEEIENETNNNQKE